ncbi:MAG: hypothetical protein WDW36_006712 [Sanguina aurantia]
MAESTAVEVTFPQLNCLIPRGKFNLALMAGQLLLGSDKRDIVIPTSSILGVVILDNVPDKTRDGKVLLLLALDKSAGVMNGNAPLEAVLILMSETEEMSVTCGSGQVLEGIAPVVLCSAFGLPLISIPPELFLSPDPEVYLSNKDLCAVGAVMKVNPGFLFPLPTALCFVERPPLFIPHSSIQSYEFGRTGGGSSTFDLLVFLHPPPRAAAAPGSGKASRPPAPLEFSQIHSSELGRLRSYFERLRFKVGTAVGGTWWDALGGGRRHMTHRLTAVTVDACVRAELAQVFTGHDEEGEEVDRGSGGSAGPSGHARASGTKRSQQAGVGALNDGADDSHASEDQDEDEDESDEDFDPDAKRARGGGEGGLQVRQYDEDSEDENSGSDVELVDEEGISGGHIRELMRVDKKQGADKKQAAAAAMAAASHGGGPSGSGRGGGSRGFGMSGSPAGAPVNVSGSRHGAITVHEAESEDIMDESEEEESSGLC